MITLKIKTIEKKFGIKVKRNINVLGVDTASRTGYATIRVNTKNLYLDYGYIDVRKLPTLNEKYNVIIKEFDNLIKTEQDRVVVEDTFFGPNVYALKLLSRIGMVVYVLSFLKNIKKIDFINASSARSKLGFNSKAKKEEIHKELRKRINIETIDKDIVDGVILALVGIMEQ